MSHSFPKHLALGCSALALATALAMPAQAQSQNPGSFQGNATVVFGSANVVQGSGTTNVNVASQSAVIDWTPFDTATSAGTPINWQPVGTQANFIGQGPNYAVLNRIIPPDTSRPITFNGTVVSRYIQGQVGFAGGTVFFYSPGGIVLSPTAVFDVGHLGLTTAPPVVGPNGDWYTNNTVQFGQAASSSAVRINAGARIGAPAEGSYVAAFAPSITQAGTVSVNGQAAYVAGEAGTITFSPDGLFDIQVSVGTDATSSGTVAISHTGTTTGPASSGLGDNHRVYAVAIPKNVAIAMAFGGGPVGFDVAGAANVVGNTVVLSAGYNIVDGQVSIPSTPLPTSAIIRMDGLSATSNFQAVASGSAEYRLVGNSSFASNATFQGASGAASTANGFSAFVFAPSGGSLNVAGNLNVVATDPGLFAAAGQNVRAANLTIVGSNYALTVGGDLTMTATGTGGASTSTIVGGTGTGGSAGLSVGANSSVSVGRDLIITAEGLGGATPPSSIGGGAGIGGSASVAAFSATGSTTPGSLTVGRVTRLISNGIGSSSSTATGGEGRGGGSFLSVSGGATITTGEASLSADGFGGSSTVAAGGRGTGGSAQINVSGINSVVTVQSSNLTGGTQERDFLSAEAFGGQTSVANGTGGSAQGGSARLSVTAGGRLTLPTSVNSSVFRIFGRATGGNVLAGVDGTGGAAQGGASDIFVDAGSIAGGTLLASSYAMAGGSTNPALASSVINGGTATGGSRTVTIQNGSTLTSSIQGGPGAQGGNASASGQGGNAIGGTARTVIDNSTANVVGNGLATFASSTPGEGAINGNASGGFASVIVRNGARVNLAAGSFLSASAGNLSFPFDEPRFGDSGGNVSGGTARMEISNSTVTGPGFLGVGADASAGLLGRAGGNAVGGVAALSISGSAISVEDITVTSNGLGAAYAPTGGFVSGITTGSGSGGSAGVSIFTGSNVTTGSLTIEANGQGGNVAAEGVGGMTTGAGTGGGAFLSVGDSALNATDIRIDASGTGGEIYSSGAGVSSGQTGTGTGGTALISLNNAAVTGQGLEMDAVGSGGTISNGQGTDFIAGNGDGGSASIGAGQGTSTLAVDFISIGSDGSGGAVEAAGGAGGTGTAGQSFIEVFDGAALTIDTSEGLNFSSEGFGGDVTLFDGTNDQYTGTGGAAQGGLELIAAYGGSLTINGNIDFEGDDEGGSGLIGGTAIGGSSGVIAQDGGSIAITGNLDISRDTEGGNGLTGGNATGGIAYLHAERGGTITVSGGNVEVVTNAYAGYDEYGTSTGSVSSGGTATGGTAQILANGGDARLTIDGGAYIYSGAFGGGSFRDGFGNPGPGGAATGGLAQIGGSGGTGNELTITGEAFVLSNAEGGDGDEAAGGMATGGRALVFAGDGTAISLGGAIVSASAIGGDVISSSASSPPAGTRGGDAVGATARLNTFGTGGSIEIVGDATIESFALGGSADFTPGDGGDGFAGFAEVFASNGMIAIGGSLLLGVETEGGIGLNGGDAGVLDDAFFRSGIGVDNGSLAVIGQTNIYATAAGGEGVEGGTGGAAVAASAYVDAASSVNGPSTITLGDVNAYSAAAGGSGGSSAGSAGGAGGSATSTAVQVFGNAGNGILNVTGNTQLFAVATGGAGGASESGTGGVGGAATGGRIQFGTRSGADVGPGNTGSATFGNISALSQGLGGAGGDSDTGIGGAGGSGTSFGGVLLVRGSPVTAQAVSITGFGLGGDGGNGATLGVGGYGAGGEVDLTASQRFERTERGSATIGSISLTSLGQGGTGSTPGASYYAGEGGVFLTQSDVTVGSLTYSNTGALPPPPEVATSVLPVSLTMSSANLTVDNLSMTTPGEFLLNLDNSRITANSFAISAGTFVLPTTPPATPGTITVRDSLSLAATAPGGSIRTFANFVSNNAASFSSVDSIVLGDIDVEGLFAATSQTGTVTVGNIDAGSASLSAQGNVQAGNVRVNTTFTASSNAGGVTIGSIDAGTANVSGPGNVQTGTVRTGGLFVARSTAGSVATGPVTASSANLLAAANLTAGAINLTGPLNLQATSGAIGLTAVNATVIQFASGAGFTANTINATSIAGNTGGTLSVLGAWSAPSISVNAIDIAITEAGSLSAGANGTINLLSRNEQGAFIGDSLAGQGGYRLSNAEFGRISANTIFIGARDFGNAVDMTIGNLTLSPSQLPGAAGSLEFATGILETSQLGGRIRIDGAITANGLSDSQYLGFLTDSFELNAETGSIALTGNGPGGLGGIVEIEAANIHVASPAILDKLRANPRYAGVTEEINAPAAVQRPNGVLRALGIQFYPSDTLYIQNTGTAANPAGFYATPDESDIEPPGFEDSSAPDVDVVINGRFATATGDISGRDVFTAVADDEEATFDGFSEFSQINGCAFASEACGGPVVDDNPGLAVLQSEFELLSGQTVEEEPFDLEESSEEEEEESEQAARAPIEPPVILIDTRPLNPPLDIVDPVSGSGNPASLSLDPAAENAGEVQ